MLLLFLVSCKNVCGHDSSTNINRKSNEINNSPSTEAPGVQVVYSPLTYDKFVSIRSNNDQFAHIGIFYVFASEISDYRLLIQAGNFKTTRLLDSITSYKGSLYDSTIYKHSETNFTPEEVDLILNYLEYEDNEDYFFDGSEYPYYPFESISPIICNGNYKFCLEIIKPNSMKDAWGIHKCVDEYPAPDHPLYGLFQLLEEHFISQFE
jgi:hypothetical protein